MYYLVYENIIFKHQHCTFNRPPVTGGLNVNVRYFAALKQLASDFYQSLSLDIPVRHWEHFLYIKFEGCDIWFNLSKGKNYVQSTPTNSFMQSFFSDTQPGIF